jgi:hypothetical protein
MDNIGHYIHLTQAENAIHIYKKYKKWNQCLDSAHLESV